MKPFSLLRWAVLVFAGACSGSEAAAPTPPPAVSHDAEGSWGQNNHGVLTPGTLFLIAVTEKSGVITGTGSFAGEAAPYGRLVVTGTVEQVSLKLKIVYIFEPTLFPTLGPDTAQLVGVLTNRDQIDGELTRNGISTPISLVRLTIGDPPLGDR
jgi:hypothetical protein